MFENQFNCFGENTEKYITFTVPIEKEVTKIDNNGEEITKNIFYKLQFIYISRFIASSLSRLVNNLSDGIHKIKCKYRHEDKKCETCGIKYKYCDRFLKYTSFKGCLKEYRCIFCNKSYQQVGWKVKREFFLIHEMF